MSGLATAMWRQSEHDLGVARRLAAAADHDWACVAAQQAAEKALKAVLLGSGLAPQPLHDLNSLFDALVGGGIATPAEKAPIQRDLILLTRAYGFSRYPGGASVTAPADAVSDEDAAGAIAAAARIIAVARRLGPELAA